MAATRIWGRKRGDRQSVSPFDKESVSKRAKWIIHNSSHFPQCDIWASICGEFNAWTLGKYQRRKISELSEYT